MSIEQPVSWSLIVNGDLKPWPVKNYLEVPITIDLNWGIDTDVYESTPLTFSVADVINGAFVEGVTIDNEHRLIICDIPIKERTKNVKVVIDWSNLKNNVKDELRVVINGNFKTLKDGLLQLTGKDIVSPIEFYFNDIKCESFMEDELDMIRVNLPYKNCVSNSKRKTSHLMIFVVSAIFVIGFILGYSLRRPEKVMSASKIAIKLDTFFISKSLNIAQTYLQKNEWHYKEMELIPELRGLFDDLKEYRFDEIKQRLDCDEFKNIHHVQKLLHVIKKMDGHESLSWYSYGDVIPFDMYIRELDGTRAKKNNKLHMLKKYKGMKIGGLKE